jgi:hypothetical protein
MNIQDAIQRLSNNKEIYNAIAKVTSVSDETCDVLLLKEDLELYDVRLKSGDGKGFLITPKVDSIVMVSYLNDTEAYVSMFSEVESYSIQTENESLKMILSDLIDAISKITVPTPTGVSSYPVNTPAFTQIKSRLDKIFKQ